MLEKQIEKAVTAHAKSLGWLAYKFVSPTCRGVPDHLYIRDGVVMFIEFKNAGGRLSKGQDIVIRRIRAERVPVHVIDSIDSGTELFNQLESTS